MPHKLDVTLPRAELAGFLGDVVEVGGACAPGARTCCSATPADGNIHVNVIGVEPGDEAVDDAVLRLVVGLGGTISAEHGIGTAKRRWLHLNRSPRRSPPCGPSSTRSTPPASSTPTCCF